MMRARGIFVLATVGALVAGACTSFSDADVPAVGPDGSADDAGGNPTNDATTTDATDGGDGCTVVLDDDFANIDPGWTVYGSPPPVAVNDSVRVISGDPGQGGALRWKAPIQARKKLIVQAAIRLGPKPVDAGIGDAIVFAWMPEGAAFQPTAKGRNAFICAGSNIGSAVYVGTGTHAVRVGQLDQSECGSGGTSLPVFDTSPHPLSFEVVGLSVIGTFDGTAFSATLPNAYPSIQFVISAASGGSYAEHFVEKLVVVACN